MCMKLLCHLVNDYIINTRYQTFGKMALWGQDSIVLCGNDGVCPA